MSKDDFEDGTSPAINPGMIGPSWLKQLREASQPQPSPLPAMRRPSSYGDQQGAQHAAPAFVPPPPPAAPVTPSMEGARTVPQPPLDIEPAAETNRRPQTSAQTFSIVWADEDGLRLAVATSRWRSRRPTEDPAGRGDAWARDPRLAGRMVSQGPFVPIDAIRNVLLESVEPTGEIAPTFVALKGELAIDLDGVARLRGLLAATEEVTLDEEGTQIVSRATAAVSKPGASRRAIEAVTKRLLEAPGMPSREGWESSVDRGLLQARSFLRVLVLGGEHVRATLTQGDATLTCYLSAHAAARLPLRRRLDALVYAEILPSQDDTEEGAFCARPLVIGGVLPLSATP